MECNAETGQWSQTLEWQSIHVFIEVFWKQVSKWRLRRTSTSEAQTSSGTLCNIKSWFTLLVDVWISVIENILQRHKYWSGRETFAEGSGSSSESQRTESRSENHSSVLQDPRKGACVTLRTFSRRKPQLSDQTSRPGIFVFYDPHFNLAVTLSEDLAVRPEAPA